MYRTSHPESSSFNLCLDIHRRPTRSTDLHNTFASDQLVRRGLLSSLLRLLLLLFFINMLSGLLHHHLASALRVSQVTLVLIRLPRKGDGKAAENGVQFAFKCGAIKFPFICYLFTLRFQPSGQLRGLLRTWTRDEDSLILISPVWLSVHVCLSGCFLELFL